MKLTYRITTAVIIRDADGKVLLGLRSAKEDTVPGFWSLPAGKLEALGPSSDVLEDNVRREVLEEIGVEIKDIRYLDSHMWTDRDPPKITIVFEAKIAAGDPKPCDTNEVTEVKWWTMEDALPLNLPPHVARVLQKKIIWKLTLVAHLRNQKDPAMGSFGFIRFTLRA